MTALRRPAPALLLAALLLALGAITAPLNHDEGQYVAGAVLAAHALPFRDFMALQPPLALWAWVPLTLAFPGWSFLAIRLSSALFGLVTLIAVHDAARNLGVSPGKRIGAPLLACCHAFLFTAAVARNDALPGMLLALGMAAALRGGGGWLVLAGLLLGLAGSAKLSFLPSLAALGIALLVVRERPWRIAAFLGGAAAGLLPLLAGGLIAPQSFWFGVFRFGASGPFDWYVQAGQASDLTWWAKLIDTGGAMLVGPALAALAIFSASLRRRGRDRRHTLMLALVAGGLLGALLPTPSHPQYLLPLLPPLFAALPDALAALRRRRLAERALILFAPIGLAPSFYALMQGSAVLRVERQAHAIGHIASGPVATLSPERVADSGLALDPRFATGPFVFRSGGVLSATEAMRFHAATPATLAAMFAAAPPGALLTGYEPGWSAAAPATDAPLVAWANAHGYRRLALAGGSLYLAPTSRRGRP